jgi:hypothetical protein
MNSNPAAWVRIMLILIFGVSLCLNCKTAQAQDTAFTQMGSWDCTFPQPGYNVPLPAGLYACPEKITFPTQFGGQPSVIFTGCTAYSGLGTFSSSHCMTFMAPTATSSVTAAVTSQDIVMKLNLNEWGPFPTFGNNPIYPKRISGTWIAVGPVLRRGTVVPKYLVLTVIYAPPGTNGGHSTSSVSYGAGSTTGLTTSASQTFKVSNSVSFEGSGGILGNGGGIGVSFAYSHSDVDSQSLDIKKTTSSTISQNGPGQDGITHDEDEIWLLLNPTVNLNLSSSSAAWILANAPSSPIQYVHVGWLNGHQPMPPGVASVLQGGGITPADYPSILARDPLASGSSTLDPNRFVSLNATFPYEPPYSANDPVPTVSFNISNSSVSTIGKGTEDTYNVGLSTSMTGDYLDFAKATFKDTTSWEWTNKSSLTSTAGSSQSATVTVGGPAYGYAGGTVMQVYLDVVYNTFAFALVSSTGQEVGLDGALLDRSGKPVPFTEVTLIENNIQHRTFTNAKGEYRFLGHISGPARIQVHTIGVDRIFPLGEASQRHVQLHLL